MIGSKNFSFFIFIGMVIVICWLALMVNHLFAQLKAVNEQLSLQQAQFQKHLQTTGNSPISTTSTQQAPSTSTAISTTLSNLPSMKEIGTKTGTDKVSRHRYHLFYPRFLEPLRTQPNIHLLEIGFLFGESFKMWKEYFPTGKIFFIDKETQGNTFPESRYTGDSGDVETLSKMLDTKMIRGKLDVIIDDGAHYSPHQIHAFQYLFVHGLKPGGVYIIEDIETSYWQSGECYGYEMRYGLNHPDALVTKCKSLVDVVNRKFSLPTARYTSNFANAKEIDPWIESIFFGLNTIVINKLSEPDYNFYNGPYSWTDNLKPPKQQV